MSLCTMSPSQPSTAMSSRSREEKLSRPGSDPEETPGRGGGGGEDVGIASGLQRETPPFHNHLGITPTQMY